MPGYQKTVEVPGKSAGEIFERVRADIERFLSKTPIGEHEVTADEASREVRVESKMFSAVIECQDGCVRVDGKLSLLASPFRGKLDEGIERWVKKSFQLA